MTRHAVTTELRPSPCPTCGEQLDCATSTFGADRPSPGDVTICLRCGGVMVFSRGLRLRKPTKAEQREFATSQLVQHVEQVRRIVMKKGKH